MELLAFYLIWAVLMTVLKIIDIRVDRRARRVRQLYSEPVPTGVRQRMVSGDQAD